MSASDRRLPGSCLSATHPIADICEERLSRLLSALISVVVQASTIDQIRLARPVCCGALEKIVDAYHPVPDDVGN